MTFISKIKNGFTQRKNAYLWLAFLMPAILMLVTYFIYGVYPFGEKSVLVLDLNAQYVYFFGALRRAIYGDASLIYSFSRALGGEFIGIFAYYLSSPLSFIVALFPENMMLDALLSLFVIKCGLCGLTLSWYLQKHNIGNKATRIVFGTLYAMCGYAIIYQHNTMWIDCMYLLPLVALGIEKLISERKYILFTVSLAVAIFSSFYIGFMMCIFCFIYYFYAYWCICKNDSEEKRHFLKSLVRMGIFSAIAIGLAASIILPTYYSLQFGKTTFSDPTYGYEPRFDFLDLVSRLFINAYDTVRPDGLPIIYCGTLTMIMLPLFFMAKKVPMRQKVGTAIMFFIFVISFSIDAVDKFWHGMQAPNWLNYRYSFMLVFLMVVAAAKAFAEIRDFTTGQRVGTIGAWFIVLLISQKTVEFYTAEKIIINRDLLCFYVAAIMLAIFAGVLALYNHPEYRSAATSVLVVFVCFEMIASSISSMYYLHDDVVYTTRTSYFENKDKFEPASDYILENDESFYRFEKTTHSLINTPMMLGIRGFTNSTSTLNHDTIDFLRYMGISSSSHWSKYFGATPAFDSFLGVKYIIADPKYIIPDGYKHLRTFYDDEGDVYNSVYQNPNALSIAYAVNSKINDITLAYPNDYDKGLEDGKYEPMEAFYSPAERMNAMMGAMLGKDTPVDIFVPINEDDIAINTDNLAYKPTGEGHEKYSPINPDQSATLIYDFTAKSTGVIYMYLPTNFPREATVKVNGEKIGNALGNDTNRMIALGDFVYGEEIKVELTLNKDALYFRRNQPHFWYMDQKLYNESFKTLSGNQFVIDNWKDTRFEGTINIPADRTTVFTSIPYDKNWRAYIDGEAVEVYETLDALVAFDAPAGNHTLVIKYVPSELYIGIAISVLSAAALAAVFFIDRKVKKRREITTIIEEL